MDEFKEYRNLIIARYGIEQKSKIAKVLRGHPDWGKVMEWVPKLVFLPTVLAKQHSKPHSWPSRTGTVSQPGRRKLRWEADVYEVKPGDYEVIIDTDHIAVPQRLFEAIFELMNDHSTNSTGKPAEETRDAAKSL